MAIAEVALRGYLQPRFKIRNRSGGLLGSAIGTGIALGTWMYDNFDITAPWSDPSKSRDKYRSGVSFIDASQKNASSYQFSKALRTGRKRGYKQRFKKRSDNSRCCCCSCN